MPTNISMKSIRKFVKGNHHELDKDIDAIISFAILLSPLYLRASFLAIEAGLSLISDLLGIKSELVSISRRIIDSVSSRKEPDPLIKLTRMEVAYGLTCYAAFFEALENQFTDLAQNIELSDSERLLILENVFQEIGRTQNEEDTGPHETLDFDGCINSPNLETGLQLPHPANDFLTQRDRLLPFYEQMAHSFGRFIKKLSISDSRDELIHAQIKQALAELPTISLQYFTALYFNLAESFNEFYVWSNLHEHGDLRESIVNLSESTQSYIELAKGEAKKVDVGFARLENAIDALGQRFSEGQKVDRTISLLHSKYETSINQKIVNDTLIEGEDIPTLHSPLKSEIFIPQSFKVLRYTNQQLESPETWLKSPSRDDLGAFILKFLKSPYSAETPLIILGHPGSGKSLLVSMLAARMVASEFLPLRVELRSAQADNSIREQVLRQIVADTGEECSWATLNASINSIPLILLDGYDELLQATGKVYGNYLNRVKEFQEDQYQVRKVPTRAIVTSRITLIDKTSIPKGSTVILLEEFDKKRINKWIKIWNDYNTQYFQDTGVKPFSLPQSQKIEALAKQPLLLSMLALFDSQDNDLHKDRLLERSVLYNKLLRQFITREVVKDPDVKEWIEEEFDEAIEQEMERLGVAAIGMFNRRQLSIKLDELNADLAFFALTSLRREVRGRSLTDAELLMGSFFFVYESKSSSVERADEHRAFEFLHNTFGEFLTADFLLRKLLDECISLIHMASSPRLKKEFDHKVSSLAGFANDWFASLIFTPLHSRTVILEMLREWLPHLLAEEGISPKDFTNQLHEIIRSHIAHVVYGSDIPHLILESGFPQLPLLGHTAIYTLNLITLGVILSNEEFVFDERNLTLYEDGTRGWDKLINIWRSWFSVENLENLTAIIDATYRTADFVRLVPKHNFYSLPSTTRLHSVYNVSKVLGDNDLSSLSGMFIVDSSKSSESEFGTLETLLPETKFELSAELLAKRIFRYLRSSSDFREGEKLLEQAIHRLVDADIPNSVWWDSLFAASSTLFELLWGEGHSFQNRISNLLARELSYRHFESDSERHRFLEDRLAYFSFHSRISSSNEYSTIVELYKAKLESQALSEVPLSTLRTSIRMVSWRPIRESRELLELLIKKLRSSNVNEISPSIVKEILSAARRHRHQPEPKGIILEIYQSVVDTIMQSSGQSQRYLEFIDEVIFIAIEQGDSRFIQIIDFNTFNYAIHKLNEHDSVYLVHLLNRKYHDEQLLLSFYETAIGKQSPRGIRERQLWIGGQSQTNNFLLYLLRLALRFGDQGFLKTFRDANFGERLRLSIHEVPYEYVPDIYEFAIKLQDEALMKQIQELLDPQQSRLKELAADALARRS